jgi:hypothetical protein
MGKPESTFRYKVRNWPEYDGVSVRRGQLTLWFDARAAGAPVVVRADFPKGAVLAYLDARNEREIVVNWRRARGVTAVAPPDSV